jgi:hypothetical protein
MIMNSILRLIIYPVVFLLIVANVSDGQEEKWISDEQKLKIFYDYGLNGTVDRDQMIQLTDVK